MSDSGLKKTQHRYFLAINKMTLKPFLTIYLLGLATGQKYQFEMLDKFVQKLNEFVQTLNGQRIHLLILHATSCMHPSNDSVELMNLVVGWMTHQCRMLRASEALRSPLS